LKQLQQNKAIMAQNMSTISLSLFWKFSIAIVLTVALFGIFTMYRVKIETYKLLEDSIKENGQQLANTSAKHAAWLIDHGTSQDTLSSWLYDFASENEKIIFIAVFGEDHRQLGSYFRETVDPTLINSTTASRETHSPRHAGFTDLTAALEPQNLGCLKLRIATDIPENRYLGVRNQFLIMVALFLIVGILGAFLFANILIAK
jgi:hypothetical protein